MYVAPVFGMPAGTTRRPPKPMTGPDVTGLARPRPPPGLLRHHAAGRTNRAAGASIPDVRQSSLPDAAPPLEDGHPSRPGSHARRRPPRAGRAPTAGRPGQLRASRAAMVVMALFPHHHQSRAVLQKDGYIWGAAARLHAQP